MKNKEIVDYTDNEPFEKALKKVTELEKQVEEMQKRIDVLEEQLKEKKKKLN